MEALSIRFLVGLSKPQDPSTLVSDHFAQERASEAMGILAHHYQFGGAYHGRGLWQGTSEPCMMFETIQEGPRAELEEKARYVARIIKNRLAQEAVGLVFAPVKFELV